MKPGILLTGGTGMLGRVLTPALLGEDVELRLLSRKGDFALDLGDKAADLRPALEDVETVVHAALSPARRTMEVDVEGTGRLLAASRGAGVRHLVYVSVTGVDRMTAFPYFRAKWEAEQVVEQGGIPWTIVRMTQFFPLVDFGLRKLPACRIGPMVGDCPLQPMDLEEGASRVVSTALGRPGGRLAEAGGPEVMPLADLARSWMAASGRRILLVPLPVVGRRMRALRGGAATCPGATVE